MPVPYCTSLLLITWFALFGSMSTSTHQITVDVKHILHAVVSMAASPAVLVT